MPQRPTWNNRIPLTIGTLALALLIGVVGTWSVATEISGAVIGRGHVQVEINRHVVQHPAGGVVSEVMVRNGDVIEAGDVVLRLDDTLLLSELAITEGELFETLAREAQLKAEFDDQLSLSVHGLLAEAADRNPDIKSLVDRQQRQLTTRLSSLRQETTLLAKQSKQLENQIHGLEFQIQAKEQKSASLNKKIINTKTLLEKGLIRESELEETVIEKALTIGDIGQLTATIAEVKEKTTEIEVQIVALSVKFRKEALEAYSQLQPSKIKLIQNRNNLLFKLSQLEVRTPVGGAIHDLQALGQKSVITAASPLMYVIPKGNSVVLARIDARDVDQVHVGQRAALRFSAFNNRSTHVIYGQVLKLSADAFVDPVSRATYYEVEISLPDSELQKLAGHELVSGMIVEAFITTESRTPLNYGAKPIIEYFNRAFRDS